jgi:hypothetical protein
VITEAAPLLVTENVERREPAATVSTAGAPAGRATATAGFEMHGTGTNGGGASATSQAHPEHPSHPPHPPGATALATNNADRATARLTRRDTA